jgi:hypothetical protein
LNKDTSISEREFEIINVIAAGSSFNQRALSAQTGMSLGMTNLLLRRLVTKGFLCARQLNQKKFEYLLTPSGFAEKARKSYRYTLKTLNSLVVLKTQIRRVIEAEIEQGHREFILAGNPELMDLVELAAQSREWTGLSFKRVNSLVEAAKLPRGLILYGGYQPQTLSSRRVVNILDNLSLQPSAADSELSESAAGVAEAQI